VLSFINIILNTISCHFDRNVTVYIGTLTDITERRQIEDKLQKHMHDLGKRVKELNCLHGISKLVETPDITTEEIIQGTIDLIPPSCQYPGKTCARAIIDGQKFKTAPFKETSWKQCSKIKIHGKPEGVLEVYLVSDYIKKATKRLTVEIEENLPTIKGDFQRLEQVMVNLIQNACQALQDNEQGILITTSFNARP